MRIISPAEAIPIWLPFWFLYHRNWSTPDFTEGLEYLRRNPALFDRRHLLSDHNGKQVWHIQLPPEYGGRNVVYKSCSTPKSGRYWFQLSQAAREHRNYQLLYRLGIPAARILAIGESRRLFNLTDRRRKRIRLTPAGRKFCGEVLETVGRIELDCIAEMNEEEQQQLIRLSRRFCANLARAVEAE